MDDQTSDTKRQLGERLVAVAGELCRTPKFSAWLARGRVITTYGGDDLESATATLLRSILIIDSRAELATNEGAQERFLTLLAEYNGEARDADTA